MVKFEFNQDGSVKNISETQDSSPSVNKSPEDSKLDRSFVDSFIRNNIKDIYYDLDLRILYYAKGKRHYQPIVSLLTPIENVLIISNRAFDTLIKPFLEIYPSYLNDSNSFDHFFGKLDIHINPLFKYANFNDIFEKEKEEKEIEYGEEEIEYGEFYNSKIHLVLGEEKKPTKKTSKKSTPKKTTAKKTTAKKPTKKTSKKSTPKKTTAKKPTKKTSKKSTALNTVETIYLGNCELIDTIFSKEVSSKEEIANTKKDLPEYIKEFQRWGIFWKIKEDDHQFEIQETLLQLATEKTLSQNYILVYDLSTKGQESEDFMGIIVNRKSEEIKIEMKIIEKIQTRLEIDKIIRQKIKHIYYNNELKMVFLLLRKAEDNEFVFRPLLSIVVPIENDDIIVNKKIKETKFSPFLPNYPQYLEDPNGLDHYFRYWKINAEPYPNPIKEITYDVYSKQILPQIKHTYEQFEDFF
jgi:hypothetical protein